MCLVTVNIFENLSYDIKRFVIRVKGCILKRLSKCYSRIFNCDILFVDILVIHTVFFNIWISEHGSPWNHHKPKGMKQIRWMKHEKLCSCWDVN